MSTIGIVYSFIVGLLIYREFDWSRLKPMLIETASLSGAILLIIGALAMGIGLFAPPFGVGYYSACAVGRIDPSDGIRPLLGYIVALVLGVILIAAVPWFSTGFL